eukprot:GHVO01042937.1.p1 GENE.GHVO01042937.1~~GHVO01042937.1.p1  ORF type:complete len:165 (+),score=22.90 GHVO01042937.1:196-690(+)
MRVPSIEGDPRGVLGSLEKMQRQLAGVNRDVFFSLLKIFESYVETGMKASEAIKDIRTLFSNAGVLHILKDFSNVFRPHIKTELMKMDPDFVVKFMGVVKHDYPHLFDSFAQYLRALNDGEMDTATWHNKCMELFEDVPALMNEYAFFCKLRQAIRRPQKHIRE